MPISSDVTIAGAVRWLSNTYPQQTTEFEKLLFGNATFRGMVDTRVIDALSAQVPANTASDNLCASLVADATIQSLNGVLAQHMAPVTDPDGIAALSAAIVNPVLEPNVAGQVRPAPHPAPPNHPRPAPDTPISDETIEAIKQAAQRAVEAALPAKAAKWMNVLLFGGYGLTGLVDNGAIAAAALNGNVIKPDDVTDLMAMSLITTAVEAALKAIFLQIGIEAPGEMAGAAGMIVLGVFKVTQLAGPGLDQTNPPQGYGNPPQQGGSPNHQTGEGHDNSGHLTPTGSSAPAGNQNPPAERPTSQPATTPTHQPDSGHENPGSDRSGGDGRLTGAGEGDNRGGGGLAKAQD